MNLATPKSISYFWNGGSLLGLVLTSQIVSGLILSFHYTADMELTFNSVIHLGRDVAGGWIVRSIHIIGASFFFVLIYMHIGRGLYYNSMKSSPMVWLIGLILYVMVMAEAFLGYVLPWGQMSYWGATVITNLLSVISESFVEWLWGGFCVAQPTLNRFYSLHFLVPFIIMLFSLMHMMALHTKGSSNPLGEHSHGSKMSFHPYFTWKDFVGVMIFILVILVFSFFTPWVFSDPDNFFAANPMNTPTHIQPEWYFLFAYAILRSIPSKLGGVVALVSSIIILGFLPLMKSNKNNTMMSIKRVAFWFFVIVFIMLSWLGGCEVETPYVEISRIMAVLYFSLLTLLSLF